MTGPADEQLALVAGPKARKSRARVKAPAASLPVARVAVDTPLAHLDRVFDYLVPEHLDGATVVGGRVRVRLAGRLLDGFVLDRVAETEHEGKLGYLERATPEPVLTAEIATLARDVADRHAGTLADVLRLAVPPRHASVEEQPSGECPTVATPSGPNPWERYAGGAAYIDALTRGDAPRAVWAALPGSTWPDEIAYAVATTLASGRTAVVVVPDARDVARLDPALTAALPADAHTTLRADLGPAERYRRFLAVRRGAVRAVVGTRAAVFAPVAAPLGLVVVWDDGDEALAEPRAPYPHARDVAVLRAHRAGAAVLVGGYSRTAEAHALVGAGWAHPLAAERRVVRAVAPRIAATGDDAALERDAAAHSARLPSMAWRAARDALTAGAPVLAQVPRRGYVPGLACGRCHARATCAHCSGPLAVASSHAIAACRWCGRPAGTWRCPVCAHPHFRATVLGARRTAEELGRAFPGTPVRTSSGDSPLTAVPAEPALVIATPGVEPVAAAGYGAVILLDTWALLGRADLRAGEEALRRWFGAAALARSATDGGVVVVVADAGLHQVQHLLRWDPAAAAEREFTERTELGLPPAVRLADLTGASADVADLLDAAELPAAAEILGPVPAADDDKAERMLVRVPRRDGAQLARALAAANAVRGARRTGAAVRIRLDPLDLG